MRPYFAAALSLAAFPAFASEGHLPHGHTHSRGEIDESHGPLLLQATYTGEVMSNASGGIKRGSRYLDNLDIVAEADLEAITGWKGASVHVYGLYNNGKVRSGNIDTIAGNGIPKNQCSQINYLRIS